MPGESLPAELEGYLEEYFSADLSGVRVHVGSAPVLGETADAAALGEEIYLRHALPSPIDAEAAGIVGHEVAHVLQHRAGLHRRRGMGTLADELERQALAHQRKIEQGFPGARPPLARLVFDWQGDVPEPAARAELEQGIRAELETALSRMHPGGKVHLPHLAVAVQRPESGDAALARVVVEQVERAIANHLRGRGGGSPTPAPGFALAQFIDEDQLTRLLFDDVVANARFKFENTLGQVLRLHPTLSDGLDLGGVLRPGIDHALALGVDLGSLLNKHLRGVAPKDALGVLRQRCLAAQERWAALGVVSPEERQLHAEALRDVGLSVEQVPEGTLINEGWVARLAQQRHGRTYATMDPSVFEAIVPQTGAVSEHLLATIGQESTLNVDAYIERHLTAPTLGFLVSEPDVPVVIFGGRINSALAHLAGKGYTRIRRLSDNGTNDFACFVAATPDYTRATLCVVCHTGVAYGDEVAAHFLCHSHFAIDPGRLTILQEATPQEEFETYLRARGIDPDVLLMGNVNQVHRLLGAGGVRPASVLRAPSLFGYVYSINGRTVLLLSIEPSLFADRAGAFLQAVYSISSKPRALVFTGTAGALTEELMVNQLVIPDGFSFANTAKAIPTGDVPNLALKLEGDKTVVKGLKHCAVDSIVLETKAWHLAQLDAGMHIVEQEVAGLAQQASIDGQTSFYAFFRISDIVGNPDHDFTESEANRLGNPEQNRLVIQALLHFLDSEELVDTSGAAEALEPELQVVEDRVTISLNGGTWTVVAPALAYDENIDLKAIRSGLSEIVGGGGDPPGKSAAIARLLAEYGCVIAGDVGYAFDRPMQVVTLRLITDPDDAPVGARVLTLEADYDPQLPLAAPQGGGRIRTYVFEVPLDVGGDFNVEVEFDDATLISAAAGLRPREVADGWQVQWMLKGRAHPE